jgi:serine/threonine-protein kinase
VLVDGEGKLPHQRSPANALLQAVSGDRYQRLAAIFDHTFTTRLEERFSNAETLRDRLTRLMQDHPAAKSLEDEIAELSALLDTPIERRRVQADEVIRKGLREVQNVYSQLLAKIGQSLTYSQTNFHVADEVGANTLYLGKLGSANRLLTTTYDIKVAGDELVLSMSGDTIYRTSLTNPRWDGDFSSIVSKWLVRQFSLAIDPDAMPPEASHFKDVPPFGTLKLAADEARRSNRKILAFVYDPMEDKRGKLDYTLCYFLENRKTRDLMNATFVTALVPLSQLSPFSEILNGASMETSRWVVFDENLHALQEAVIYANPQEAERIVGELAKQYGPGFSGQTC